MAVVSYDLLLPDSGAVIDGAIHASLVTAEFRVRRPTLGEVGERVCENGLSLSQI